MSALLTELMVPFGYDYMLKAMWVSALVGAVCAFLSAYLMLKGWSLMGDALGHSIVPGVAAAYIIGAPFAVGGRFGGDRFRGLNRQIDNRHVRCRNANCDSVHFSQQFRQNQADGLGGTRRGRNHR